MNQNLRIVHTDIIAKNRIRICQCLLLLVSFDFIINLDNRITKVLINLDNLLYCIILISLGVVIRSWAAGILIKRNRLTIEGPFNLNRNPLYSGSLLILLGLGVFFNSILCWLVILFLIIIVFPLTIRREEQLLSQKFPEEWECYKASVGRFIPKKPEWSKVKGSWSLNLWLKNKEYYTVICASMFLLLILTCPYL